MDTYSEKEMPQAEAVPEREETVPQEGAPVQENIPAQDDTPVQETSPVEETTPVWQEEPEPVEQEMPKAEPAYRPPEPAMEKPAEKRGGRHVGFWILAILLAASLLLQALSLCGVGVARITGTAINDQGELVITYSDGSTDNLGVVVGADGANGSNGTTTIISSEDSATVSISNALRSSVSIYCTFVQEGRWGRTTESYSAGSGVIYQLDKAAGDAIIVTNYHVVYSASSRQENGIAEGITVYLYGSEVSGMELEATYVGGSMYYDIAVLRVRDSDVLKDSEAVAVTVADSDAVQVGSTAIAIGNAEGSGISATSGIVSVASEYITMTAADGVTAVNYRVMRVDTAVNSGNSGGGLFDSSGRLIGIVNAKTVTSGVENIGYALPSSVVEAVVDNILDYCLDTDCESVMRALLGVTVKTVSSQAVYDEDTGLLSVVQTVAIYEVSEDQIGNVFQEGDILVSVELHGETRQLTQQYHVIDLLLTARVGDEVTFTVLRDGEQIQLTVTITEDCLSAY